MLVCIHIHHTIMACSPCLLTVRVQAAVQKDYPDKMVVTVTQCLLSTAQSFVVAVVAERDFSKWKLRFDISLLAVLYSVVSTIHSFIYLVTIRVDDGRFYMHASACFRVLW
jgi:hypothetical protein